MMVMCHEAWIIINPFLSTLGKKGIKGLLAHASRNYFLVFMSISVTPATFYSALKGCVSPEITASLRARNTAYSFSSYPSPSDPYNKHGALHTRGTQQMLVEGTYGVASFTR